LVLQVALVEHSNPFPEPETKSSPTRCSLDDLHLTFHRWFGADYDLDAIDAVLAAIASEGLTARTKMLRRVYNIFA
jgi:hypothetical protein